MDVLMMLILPCFGSIFHPHDQYSNCLPSVWQYCNLSEEGLCYLETKILVMLKISSLYAYKLLTAINITIYWIRMDTKVGKKL